MMDLHATECKNFRTLGLDDREASQIRLGGLRLPTSIGNRTLVLQLAPVLRQTGAHSLLQYFSKTGVDSGGTEWTREDKIRWRKPSDVST